MAVLYTIKWKMSTYMKFSWLALMRECQPGTQSARKACLTVKPSASGTQARSRLGPATDVWENPNCCVILLPLIQVGYFPDAWKRAKIKMILKPGKQGDDSSNYRPISLLSCVGKLLERLISRVRDIHNYLLTFIKLELEL